MAPSSTAKVAARLVRDTPPGQLREVLTDVRVLVGAEDREAVENALPAVVADVHAREYAVVKLPSGESCLLTPDGLRPGGGTPTFYDPASRQLLEIDFGVAPRGGTPGVAVCKGVSPLPSAEVALFEPAEALRTCIERALGAYVREMYPAGAHLTVYGTATGEAGKGQLKVVACYGAKSAALGNFYAGGLCARWQVLVSPGEGAEVCGGVRARVHYFEEGNVQLNLSRSWQHALDAADGDEQLAEALVELVRSSEGDWHERLLDAFADLGEHALKALRRPLPMTRTKFDWDRAAQHELADQLANAKI